MTVAALITQESQIDEILSWGSLLAEIEKTDLLLIVPQKSKSERSWVELTDDRANAGSSVLSAIQNRISIAAGRDQEDSSKEENGEDKKAPPPAPAADQTASTKEGKANEPPPQVQDEVEPTYDPPTVSSDDSVTPPQTEADSVESDPVVSDGSPPITCKILQDPRPGWALVEEIESLKIKLLLLPQLPLTRGQSDESSWQRSLYKQAPCETIQIQCREQVAREGMHLLVVLTGKQDDGVALRRAHSMAETRAGQLTALFCEPEIDPVSQEVGHQILQRILKDTFRGNFASVDDQIKKQVVLASSVVQGLDQVDTTPFDMILVGTRLGREIKQLWSYTPTAAPGGDEGNRQVAIAIVRKRVPLTNQFVGFFSRAFEKVIPQLNREQRIDLVRRIQGSSQWDFDFVALIFLSTLIAGLGLIRNSASVVIGAMLVAPLMTPIVGTGLGISHGNLVLIRQSLRTVFRGFATAFLLSICIGFLVQPEITTEMAGRGTPNFLDLVVAFVSGIAAAYAMGRPNLLSALPGVAIAAALVPPLAVSGIATASANFRLSEGALLLFLTNIVAIVLGTTLTFWAVGVRQIKKDKPTPIWPLLLLLVLVGLSILLIAVMNLPIFASEVGATG